ncbi:MAG: DUF3450 family protein [Bdellovibrionaceae bacterium]|nr:DUF3450 family protein [Pseudobdellovibrionaceae bacterium]
MSCQILFLSLVIAFLFVSNSSAKDWEDISKERAELELLVQKINLLQKNKNQQIELLLNQKTELEAENSLLHSSLSESKKNYEKTLIKATIHQTKINTKEWESILDIITKKYDNTTAPDFLNYNLKKKTLVSIKESFKNPKDSIETSLSLLLTFLEKEYKESKSFEYMVTELDLEGRKQTVELIRLGEVLGYYRTSHKKNGIWFKDQKQKFITEDVNDSITAGHIDQFFLDIKNQKKWGLHENLILPKNLLN